MALFQFFLLTNLLYLLLLGILGIGVALIFSLDPSLLQVIGISLASLILLGFVSLNFFLWRYRFFLLFMSYKQDILSYAGWLHQKYQEYRLKGSRNLGLYLQVCFLAGKSSLIDELLSSELGKPHSRRFNLDAAGYFLLQGKIQSASKWLEASTHGSRDKVVLWFKEALFVLSDPAHPKPEIFVSWEENTFAKKSLMNPAGWLALRVLNLYFYQIFAKPVDKGAYNAVVEALVASEYHRDYNSLQRYPLFFMSLSAFWSEALSSLFGLKSIK